MQYLPEFLWADPEADPRIYSTDPAAVDPLVVADLGGNEFEVTLPAEPHQALVPV